MKSRKFMIVISLVLVKEWENRLSVKIETIVTNGDDNDPQQQVRDLEDLSIQGVDVVAIFPGDYPMDLR